jgi:hypothetical protein
LMGGHHLKRRHDHLLAVGRKYAQMEQLWRDTGPAARAGRIETGDNDKETMEVRQQHAKDYCGWLASYYGSLARKYRRGARHPWLPIEPDPPQPE